MNPLVIYHANCADGFTAAWCFHHYAKHSSMEIEFDFHPGVYNDPPPDCTDRVVYLVDFSYKRAVVEGILRVAEEVILIDHHKTAIEDLSPLFKSDSWSGEPKQLSHYTDINRSGAMLAWDYLFNWGNPDKTHPLYKQPPLLLEYVQDRDLWKFKLELTREVSAAIFSHAYSFDKWDTLMSGGRIEMMKMASEGHAIERKHHKDIKELLNVCQHFGVIAGHTVPVANLPYTLASDACHNMAKNYKDGTVFAASYYDTGSHRVYSLRSCDNGMDVSEIAKQYPGGGGHKHAAGFRIPLSSIMKETDDGK